MASLSDKIFSNFAAGIAGVALGTGIALGTGFAYFFSIAGTRYIVPSMESLASNPGVHPADLDCETIEEGMKKLRALIPTNFSPPFPGCHYYTNPLWQFVCDQPEQYEPVKMYYGASAKLGLLESWYSYKKCKPESPRPL